MKQAVEMKKDRFTLRVNYSEEAAEKKLMQFETPSGDTFEISADEMATILVGQLNSELVEAAFVESDRVNVVEVQRQFAWRADRDIAKGEELRIDYYHPYPVEFAIIEEGMKLAKIRMDVPRAELTVEYLNSVRDRIGPKQRRFVDLIWKFIKRFTPSGKKADTAM